jgi:hypothetical protein
MVKIKEMSFDKKYQGVLDGVDILETFSFATIRESLGDQKVEELKNIWLKQSEPVPETASVEEKYHITYRNWLRNWETAYDFVNSQLGEKGIEQFKRASVKEWTRRNAGAPLQLFKFMRFIAPKTAFKTFGKQIAHQWQAYFTQSSVSELTGQRLVLDVANCDFLAVEGCTHPCTIGCQQISPMWLKEQFKLEMTPKRKEAKDCTITVTPL